MLQLDKDKVSLRQRTFLFDYLSRDEAIKAHFDLTALEQALKTISVAEYKYINALYINKKRVDLNLKLKKIIDIYLKSL